MSPAATSPSGWAAPAKVDDRQTRHGMPGFLSRYISWNLTQARSHIRGLTPGPLRVEMAQSEIFVLTR
jgi:hypothetical protein